MTYCSGFTRHQPCHANFKRIHRDSEETKPCHVAKCCQGSARTHRKVKISEMQM